jgi:hypothetical protein
VARTGRKPRHSPAPSRATARRCAPPRRKPRSAF